MKSLVSYLAVTDTRKPKGIRHKQTMTLVIMIMSIRCGYTGFEVIAIDGKSINSTVTHCHDSQPNVVSRVSFFGQRSH